ncbi:MAG: radical SAM protein, partial [Planctomycetes bacterium]|nr:radical SAM protein [Planctomycetota bacterium]
MLSCPVHVILSHCVLATPIDVASLTKIRGYVNGKVESARFFLTRVRGALEYRQISRAVEREVGMEARAFPVGHTGSCVAEKPHVLGRNPLVSVGLVINKVTHACNLHCTYCNQRHPPQSPSDGFMSLDTFLAAADAVLRHTRERRVRWIFHGGEPLLLGADWLGKAMEHARRRASEAGIQITFGIQTNGTLLDPESASLVRRFGVRLGVSLDGPPEINDHTRGQTAELLRNLMMLRQMGIRCGAICVLSQSNVGRMSEVLRFFSDIGLRSLKFNSCCESGPNLPSPLGAEDLFRAKVEILDQMRASPRPVRDDNLIRMLEKYFAAPGDKRAEGGICAAAVCGAGRRVVGLGPEGSFYPCGRADGDGQTRLGSVTNGGLDPQTWKEALDRFHSVRPYLDQCGGCAAKKICSFGCAAYEKLDPEFFRRECLWTRMLFDHLRLHEDEARHVFTVTKRRNGIP